MKISVNKILYHWYTKIPKNFKSKSFQISFMWNTGWDILMDINFDQSFGNIFIIRFYLLGLFDLNIYKNKECDHAGSSFNLNILGLDLEYENKDVRHYDYDNDKWED